MSHAKEEKSLKEIFALRPASDQKTILQSDRGTIIYGAGETGRRVRLLLKRHGVRIDCFLDEKGGQKKFVDKIPVFKPDSSGVDKKANVIVALFNHLTEINSVITLLKRQSFTKIIPYTELFLSFADELPAHYWLGSARPYKAHLPEILAVLSMLEDQSSKELFLSWLKFRLTGNPNSMPKPQKEDIYFPLDISGRIKPYHFLDCGAFSGDTLILARKKFGLLESVRAFEPDRENYQKLVKLNKKTPLSKDTVLFPYGVWSTAAQLRFTSQSSNASSVSSSGGKIVKCVTLDDCLEGYRPTLIKMDVEGSELEALKGCKQIIKSVRPQLAISVYHVPDHLWQIPLLIKKMVPEYKVFLRSHGANGYDTVFYAQV